MSVYQYKKYKVSFKTDSNKTQGLQTGDVVRRQYFDGNNIIYSLMVVLDYGVDKVVDSVTSDIKDKPFFIGALLDGDVPKSDELLDFARVTNLFDIDRSGALYLTASDDEAPYMDIIDGIGRNESLCWPENIASDSNIDSFSQYVILGKSDFTYDYTKSQVGADRICHLKRTGTATSVVGIEQDFYQYVANPNRVLVSYKIKASKSLTAKASIGYLDDTKTDGSVDVSITTEWQYKLHAITVDYSGRHLRKFKLDLSSMAVNDEVYVADLNVILLSSIGNFGDASQIRVGKLDGVIDPVFGKLSGYGGYMQKLYASNSAHISGTLTAGDENGFGATFYAGKIHRNACINSISPSFTSSVTKDTAISNPTGAGNVYKSSAPITIIPQTNAWLVSHVDSSYAFSFWVYCKKACQLSVLQNGKQVTTIQVDYSDTHKWQRVNAIWKLLSPTTAGDAMNITLSPAFSDTTTDAISTDSSIIAQDQKLTDEATFYFSAPQLEPGNKVTQYQPTDSVLNYVEDYGAWFSRGGIGGTMQNPLIQLNYDGAGSIGTATKSLLLKTDGSGYLANQNIKWDSSGKVTFGSGVTLNWSNLDSTVKSQLVSKSIKVLGQEDFTVITKEDGTQSFSPATINLSVSTENIDLSTSTIQWSYFNGSGYTSISGATGSTLSVSPSGLIWIDDNKVTIKCTVTSNEASYIDTITINKQYINGYSVIVTSQKGTTFKNGVCQTTLEANVYYNGKLLSVEEAANKVSYLWHKYNVLDMSTEMPNWWVSGAIDTSARAITLNYSLNSSECYVCEISEK